MAETWVFGTSPVCSVRISNDPYVSPQHCAVTLTDEGTVTVEDLGSTNGTWVRSADQRGALGRLAPGHRVVGPTRIGRGTIVRIGRTDIPWTR